MQQICWCWKDTAGVIRRCRSKKDRQQNGKKKQYKGTKTIYKTLHWKQKTVPPQLIILDIDCCHDDIHSLVHAWCVVVLWVYGLSLSIAKSIKTLWDKVC